MSAIRPTNRDRLGAAAITATVVAALGYALIAGLGVAVPREIAAPLAVFTLAPEPPPPPEPLPPAPVRDTKPSGAAAPANLRSKATPVTAPVPIVPLVTPPPVTIAPKPDSGADSSTGAADVPGPGPGSGGDGNGTGSGNGNGSGAGGVPPHRIAGRLSKGDLPEALIRPGGGGTVSVLYVVSPQGRVTDCEVTRSSGNPELDDMTCRLIEQRFRFEPSRDAAGRAVESMVEENHTWVIE